MSVRCVSTWNSLALSYSKSLAPASGPIIHHEATSNEQPGRVSSLAHFVNSIQSNPISGEDLKCDKVLSHDKRNWRSHLQCCFSYVYFTTRHFYLNIRERQAGKQAHLLTLCADSLHLISIAQLEQLAAPTHSHRRRRIQFARLLHAWQRFQQVCCHHCQKS